MPAARFAWYELMTGDVGAAAAFYSEVVGWAAQDSGMPGIDYTLLKAGDARLAGLMALPPELRAAGQPAAWRGYIAVDDVDATAARLLQAGGKVLRPADDIPGVGRFASVADPQGAPFVLFKPLPGEAPPVAAADAPGVVLWHELRARDGLAVFDFYAALFGWTKGASLDLGPRGLYQSFEIDGAPSGGIMNDDPGASAPGWRYLFRVDALGAAEQRLVRLGGTVTVEAHQVPSGNWVLHARDPQGAVFALVSTAK